MIKNLSQSKQALSGLFGKDFLRFSEKQRPFGIVQHDKSGNTHKAGKGDNETLTEKLHWPRYLAISICNSQGSFFILLLISFLFSKQLAQLVICRHHNQTKKCPVQIPADCSAAERQNDPQPARVLPQNLHRFPVK